MCGYGLEEEDVFENADARFWSKRPITPNISYAFVNDPQKSSKSKISRNFENLKYTLRSVKQNPKKVFEKRKNCGKPKSWC